MAHSRASTMDRDSAPIAAIEAEAHAWCKANAKKTLLEILGGGAKPAGASRRKRRAKSPPKRQTSGRKRAPRGSVSRFAEHVLRACHSSTVSDIPGNVVDETEHSVKSASIPIELRNGRMQCRHVSDNGHCSHTSMEATAQAPVEAAPPGSAADCFTDETADGHLLESDDGADSETREGEGKETLDLNPRRDPAQTRRLRTRSKLQTLYGNPSNTHVAAEHPQPRREGKHKPTESCRAPICLLPDQTNRNGQDRKAATPH